MIKKSRYIIPIVSLFILSATPVTESFGQAQAKAVIKIAPEVAKGARDLWSWAFRAGTRSSGKVAAGTYPLKSILNNSELTERLRYLEVELLRKDGTTQTLSFESLDNYFYLWTDGTDHQLQRKNSSVDDVVASITYKNPLNPSESNYLWKNVKYDDREWNMAIRWEYTRKLLIEYKNDVTGVRKVKLLYKNGSEDSFEVDDLGSFDESFARLTTVESISGLITGLKERILWENPKIHDSEWNLLIRWVDMKEASELPYSRIERKTRSFLDNSDFRSLSKEEKVALVEEVKSLERIDFRSIDRGPASTEYHLSDGLTGQSNTNDVIHLDEFAQITSESYNPQNALIIKHIRLDGGGSGALILTPNKELILIDGGFTKGDYIKLEGIISSVQTEGEVKSLHVIVTHPDRDHIGNVERLIKAGQGFEEIIVPNIIDLPRSERRITALSETLLAQGYDRQVEQGTLLRFRKKGIPANVRFENFRRSTDEQVQYGQIVIGESIKIKLVHFLGGRKVNDRSLLLNVEHNGKRCLFTGDVEMRALQEIKADLEVSFRRKKGIELAIKEHVTWFNDNLKELQKKTKKGDIATHSFKKMLDECNFLQKNLTGLNEEHALIDFPETADFLVWPHHYWLPKDNKEPIVSFVKMVNPRIIILTQPPKSARQDVDKLRAFLNALKNEDKNLNFEVIDVTSQPFMNGIQLNVNLLTVIFEKYFG